MKSLIRLTIELEPFDAAFPDDIQLPIMLIGVQGAHPFEMPILLTPDGEYFPPIMVGFSDGTLLICSLDDEGTFRFARQGAGVAKYVHISWEQFCEDHPLANISRFEAADSVVLEGEMLWFVAGEGPNPHEFGHCPYDEVAKAEHHKMTHGLGKLAFFGHNPAALLPGDPGQN